MVSSELIAGLVDKSPEARENVARLVYERVWRVTRSICATEADAEDVTQHALMEILSSAEEFLSRGGGAFEHWVDRIATRRALETQKRESRRRRSLARWLVPGSLPWGVESKVSLNEPISVDSMLSPLSPARRQVVLMHHGLGYTVDEVAELLDAPRGTVKDRLFVAKRQLRKALRRDFEDRA
jgi:RNA polymerase sigma-70 factor (ECF subfamily)